MCPLLLGHLSRRERELLPRAPVFIGRRITLLSVERAAHTGRVLNSRSTSWSN
jgi:hypothetical protein